MMSPRKIRSLKLARLFLKCAILVLVGDMFFQMYHYAGFIDSSMFYCILIPAVCFVSYIERVLRNNTPDTSSEPKTERVKSGFFKKSCTGLHWYFWSGTSSSKISLRLVITIIIFGLVVGLLGPIVYTRIYFGTSTIADTIRASVGKNITFLSPEEDYGKTIRGELEKARIRWNNGRYELYLSVKRDVIREYGISDDGTKYLKSIGSGTNGGDFRLNCSDLDRIQFKVIGPMPPQVQPSGKAERAMEIPAQKELLQDDELPAAPAEEVQSIPEVKDASCEKPTPDVTEGE